MHLVYMVKYLHRTISQQIVSWTESTDCGRPCWTGGIRLVLVLMEDGKIPILYGDQDVCILNKRWSNSLFPQCKIIYLLVLKLCNNIACYCPTLMSSSKFQTSLCSCAKIVICWTVVIVWSYSTFDWTSEQISHRYNTFPSIRGTSLSQRFYW